MFEDTKALICRHVTLSYFRPEVDSVVQVDVSSRGLGAVLLQNGKPIAFASKTLSDCEQRYANIEREMLAVVFGCERFHTYLFGKRFLVQSDQKPLEMIHRKNLAAAPQRLQRMLLRLQPYDFELRYKPGKEMALADTMSRQPCRDKEQIELDVQIMFVQFSTKILQEWRGETQADDELCALKTVITDGWPERQSSLPATLRSYWSCCDELSIEDSLIMKGDRLVIPSSMQVQILAKLHESHQGIEKTRLRARATVYWKNINRDIDEIVRKCDVCQQMQRSQQMLNARKFKTNVPVKIRNEHWRKEDIGQRLTDRHTSQRINHDRRGATDLARLIPGQDVRVQDTITGVWQPAKVVSLCPEPRSYNVQSPSGNMLRRNRRHIRETSESHAGLHQQDDNPVPNESEHQTQATVEPVTPSSQNQHPKKTVRFEDSAERTCSGRRVKPPKRWTYNK